MKMKISRRVLKQAVKKRMVIKQAVIKKPPQPFGRPQSGIGVQISAQQLKNNELVKQAERDVKALFARFAKRRKRKGQTASPQLFNLIMQRALQQGQSSSRYDRFYDKMMQVMRKAQYVAKQGQYQDWRTRRMGIKPRGQKTGKFYKRPKSVKVGAAREGDQEEPDEEQLADLRGLTPQDEQDKPQEKKPEQKK